MPQRRDPPENRDWPGVETTDYLIHTPNDDWEQWADTVPRSTPLYYRLYTLICEDLHSSRAGGYDEMEERTARLLASRIERRSITARQAMERGDDESVREHLEKIEEIAATFGE